MGGPQLVEAVSHPGLVDGHLAGHEDEAVKHHTGADDRNVLEGLLEDDVDVAMHLWRVRVAYPPEIQPVGVDLVVRDHNDALGKGEMYAAVPSALDLAGDRVIAAYAYGGGAPDLGHGGYQKAEGLLREGHVCVIDIAADYVERCADKLGNVDARAGEAGQPPNRQTADTAADMCEKRRGERTRYGRWHGIRDTAGQEVGHKAEAPQPLRELALLPLSRRMCDVWFAALVAQTRCKLGGGQLIFQGDGPLPQLGCHDGTGGRTGRAQIAMISSGLAIRWLRGGAAPGTRWEGKLFLTRQDGSRIYGRREWSSGRVVACASGKVGGTAAGRRSDGEEAGRVHDDKGNSTSPSSFRA